jgi:hypothetical protein
MTSSTSITFYPILIMHGGGFARTRHERLQSIHSMLQTRHFCYLCRFKNACTLRVMTTTNNARIIATVSESFPKKGLRFTHYLSLPCMQSTRAGRNPGTFGMRRLFCWTLTKLPPAIPLERIRNMNFYFKMNFKAYACDFPNSEARRRPFTNAKTYVSKQNIYQFGRSACLSLLQEVEWMLSKLYSR